MPLLIAAGVFFLALAYYMPDAFIAIAEFVDGSRCAIGMTIYCDQNYDNIKNFGND